MKGKIEFVVKMKIIYIIFILMYVSAGSQCFGKCVWEAPIRLRDVST
jgi:hypothetical protein